MENNEPKIIGAYLVARMIDPNTTNPADVSSDTYEFTPVDLGDGKAVLTEEAIKEDLIELSRYIEDTDSIEKAAEFITAQYKAAHEASLAEAADKKE